MSSVSSAPSELVTSLPTPAHPRSGSSSREAMPAFVVLAVLFAAVVWASIAQVRSQPLAGEGGPEAGAIMIVD